MSLTKHVPQRTCVGCRQQKSKRELIRVVRAPEGEVAEPFAEVQRPRGVLGDVGRETGA